MCVVAAPFQAHPRFVLDSTCLLSAYPCHAVKMSEDYSDEGFDSYDDESFDQSDEEMKAIVDATKKVIC